MGSLAWPLEQPRNLALPAPHSGSSGSKLPALKTSGTQPETLRAMRDKLAVVTSENGLLGELVRELKAERDGLSRRLVAAQKQLRDASGRATAGGLQAANAGREAERLRARSAALAADAAARADALEDTARHAAELEDLALELRQQLDAANAATDAATAAAGAASTRAAAAEAALLAAGVGPLPPLGPTAERLVAHSAQRIGQLEGELRAAQRDAAMAAEQARELLAERDSVLAEATAAAAREKAERDKDAEARAADAEARAADAEARAAAAEARAAAAERLSQGAEARAAVPEGKAQFSGRCSSKGDAGDHQPHNPTARDASSKPLAPQPPNAEGVEETLASAAPLQAGSSNNESLAAAAAAAARDAALREVGELRAALLAARQDEGTARVAAGEAGARAERLRGEVVRCTAELQTQLAETAAARQQCSLMTAALSAAEASATAARGDAAQLREQLVSLASVTLSELREAVAGEAVAITGLPGGAATAAALPLPVSSYIKVLEHAVCECEQRCGELLRAAQVAAQQEHEARAALAAVRQHAAAAERALQQQTARLIAGERLRLADMREAQGLERRLAAAQREVAQRSCAAHLPPSASHDLPLLMQQQQQLACSQQCSHTQNPLLLQLRQLQAQQAAHAGSSTAPSRGTVTALLQPPVGMSGKAAAAAAADTSAAKQGR